MSNKTRSILKVLAIIVVLLTVLMQLQIVLIPALSGYSYWMVVLSFALLLLASK